MKKIYILIFSIIILCLIVNIFGCSKSSTQNEELDNSNETEVTDLLGRTIKFENEINHIVAIGPGALRLCCYFNNIDMIAGIEQMDKDSSIGRPYLKAYAELSKLPTIGQGGPNNSPNPEQLIAVNPDVIFTTYSSDKSTADNLELQTGIPVVALSYGKTGAFNSTILDSLTLIGKVIKNEKRATELTDYIKEITQDIETRTQDIPDEEKPSTYIGCLGMKGTHGIESTQGEYILFKYVNANNVVDETGKSGSVMIDKEKLIQWNPDKIFADFGGVELLKEDYNKNRDYYDTLDAFKNEDIYLQLPYNYYSTNISTALIDAYFIGKTLYPEKFEDIEIDTKADEIYSGFFKKKLYNDMIQDYGKLGKLDISSF